MQMAAITNVFYLENGFKVYITLQASKKKKKLLILPRTESACCWKLPKNQLCIITLTDTHFLHIFQNPENT